MNKIKPSDAEELLNLGNELDRYLAEPYSDAKTLDDVQDMGNRGKALMELARDTLLAPESKKTEPCFSIPTITQVTGLHRSTVSKAFSKYPDLPQGRVDIGKGVLVPYEKAVENGLDVSGHIRRNFNTKEIAAVIQKLAPNMQRYRGSRGAVIGVCNYKGGVSKTITSMCLSQALSIRGKRVLCIDLDPQGSMTNMFGFLHVKDVDKEDTALGLFQGKTTTLDQCIRSTYWSNIDLIPASSDLQGSEFALRSLLEKQGLEFVTILANAIDKLMYDYDVCIIDTPPSLNSLTNSALFAADGIIMPIPASNIELASAVQFWDMYSEICKALPNVSGSDKVFDFVKVVIPKMENTVACRNVRSWIQQIYGADVMEHEVPKSAAVARANESFGTVFDVLPDANKKLLDAQLPVRQAYELLAQDLEKNLKHIWATKAYADREAIRAQLNRA